jgi:predicted dithiol-disulfide oxidoreductase (DUF899 family)
VSRGEWLEQRKALLAKEKEFTRLGDRLAADKRTYGVSFKPEDTTKGKLYNYGTRQFPSEEAPGISVFYKDNAGNVFHTYSSFGRGPEFLIGVYNFLDLVPKGRDEAGLPFTMAWVRHHDRYEE